MIKFKRIDKVLSVPNSLGNFSISSSSTEEYNRGLQDGIRQGTIIGANEQKEKDDAALTPNENITENGSYTAEYGFKKVTVDVPDKYDEGYDQGYDNGYNAGEAVGYDEGYEKGEAKGWEEGYAKGDLDGYDKGIADGFTNGKEAQKAEDDSKITPSTTITGNGEYEADYGYKKVIVNVEGGTSYEPFETFVLKNGAVVFDDIFFERDRTYVMEYSNMQNPNNNSIWGSGGFIYDYETIADFRNGIGWNIKWDTSISPAMSSGTFNYKTPSSTTALSTNFRLYNYEKPIKRIRCSIGFPSTGDVTYSNCTINRFGPSGGGTTVRRFSDNMLNTNPIYFRGDIGTVTDVYAILNTFIVYNYDETEVKHYIIPSYSDNGYKDLVTGKVYPIQNLYEGRTAEIIRYTDI